MSDTQIKDPNTDQASKDLEANRRFQKYIFRATVVATSISMVMIVISEYQKSNRSTDETTAN